MLGYLLLLAQTISRVFQRRIRQHITEQKPMHGARSGRPHYVRAHGFCHLQIFKYRKVFVFQMSDGKRARESVRPLIKRKTVCRQPIASGEYF